MGSQDERRARALQEQKRVCASAAKDVFENPLRGSRLTRSLLLLNGDLFHPAPIMFSL